MDLQLGGGVWDTEILEVSLEIYVSTDIRIEPVCQLIHALIGSRLTWVPAPLIPLVALVELPYTSGRLSGRKNTYTHERVLVEQDLEISLRLLDVDGWTYNVPTPFQNGMGS